MEPILTQKALIHESISLIRSRTPAVKALCQHIPLSNWDYRENFGYMHSQYFFPRQFHEDDIFRHYRSLDRGNHTESVVSQTIHQLHDHNDIPWSTQSKTQTVK